MSDDEWLATNQKAISDRLQWLLSKPEGGLYVHGSKLHRIVVHKEGTCILLRFVDSEGKDRGPMSEIDLRNALALTPGYNRAMMLFLLWKSDPRSIYHIGFGGGRLPLVLHHHFPHLSIESTEIDTDVLQLAQRFFGVQFDHRQKVYIQDGRRYLEDRSPQTRYDVIMVDAFRGAGYIPYHLSTKEFYDLCRSHLTEGGVVAANLLEGDPLYRQRVNTIQESFKHVYLIVHEGGKVAFGSDSVELDMSCIQERISQLQDERGFSFPLLPYAERLSPVSEQGEYLARFGNATNILRDGYQPPEIEQLPVTDSIFRSVGRNDPCPCGSGKKFKHCHGLHKP